MMNYGMPSLVPPATLLIPYPVIVPLPVPIPIPIPIPYNPQASWDKPERSGPFRSAPESSEFSASGPHSPGPSGGHRGEQKVEPSVLERLSPAHSERSRTGMVDLTVKAEDNLGNLCPTSCPGPMDGVIDLTVGQRTCQQQVIQRITRGPAQTQPQSQTPPHLQTNPAALCNVIVNGSGWHPLLPPAFESYPERDSVAGEGEAQPANGDLEHEALKENNCSVGVGDWEPGKRGLLQDEMADTVEGKPDPDSNAEEGEHAYSVPLLSTGGCVVIQPVPKPGADKTAILSCSISAPLSVDGSPELEPPLKRRCLRIRNQNK
ncbi:hypothetical protein F7725_007726 [Dissostichus mawsoni]|uniref:Uncharacterized protein n=1 Tax=Dissostichus mawsoni TaxID=36200 RepID=A0A7J5Y647_DISMA|nr:hypothetical protein F7725_007726 [Dissostichus mawsoni]